MTDNISRLREAWEKMTPGEWYAVNDCVWAGPTCVSYTETVSGGFENDMLVAEWIALAHNEFGKILAVLTEAEALAAYDDYEGPRVATWDDFRSALSALKGGTE